MKTVDSELKRAAEGLHEAVQNASSPEWSETRRRTLSPVAATLVAILAVALAIGLPAYLLGTAQPQEVGSEGVSPGSLVSPAPPFPLGDRVPLQPPNESLGQTYLERFTERLPSILDSASTFQRDILSDRIVTETEQRAALDAWRGCVEDSGATIIGLQLYPNGLIAGFSVAGDGSVESADAADAATESCTAEYYSFIEEGRRATLHPDWTEVTELELIADCLLIKGYEVGESPEQWSDLKAEAQRLNALEELHACNDQVQGS